MTGLHRVSVGDTIAVQEGWRLRPIELRTVVKVTQTYVVDSEGQKWARSGYRYGPATAEGKQWTSARPLEPEDSIDDEKMARRAKKDRLIRVIRSIPWEKLETPELEQVARIAERIEERKDAEQEGGE